MISYGLEPTAYRLDRLGACGRQTHARRALSFRILAAVAAAALAAAAPRARAMESFSQITDLLRERGVAVDSNTAQRAAIEGMLRSVDPEARIMTRADAISNGMWTAPASTNTIFTNRSASAAAARRSPSVRAKEEWPAGLAYVGGKGLFPGSGDEIVRGIRALAAKKDRSGLILDLRGAAGDDVYAVDSIAGLFTPPGRALYRIADGLGHETTGHSREGAPSLDLPVMVLADRRTSGGSELLAAVLKGCRGVMLVGSATRGDNRLRELIPLADDRFVYVAARWAVLADGSSYQGAGIAPDIAVDGAPPAAAREPASSAATNRPAAAAGKGALSEDARALRERTAGDPVLARATDILLGLRALGAHANRTDDRISR